jgi:hypothetical protein
MSTKDSKLTQAFADHQRPFELSGLEAVVQVVPGGVCGEGWAEVHIAGSGQGTHVGQYTITRRHCSDSEGTYENGTFELTAAKGDKIFATYSGHMAGVVEVDADGNPMVIKINATQVITGGTGRFTNAQGQSECYGEYNVIDNQGDFTMEGWISY